MQRNKSVIAFHELPDIRKHHHGKLIIYVTGVFDLLHPGHIVFLEHCKMLGDLLVVGVGNDTQVGKLKPGRPFYSETWRQYIIGSLKPVDFCFIGPPESETHPLEIVELGFKALQPDVYVIRHDTFDIPLREKLAQKYNVKVIVLSRRDLPEFEVSTSLTIERIKKSSNK